MSVSKTAPQKNLKIRLGTKKDFHWISRAQVKMAAETEDMVLNLRTVRKGVQKVLSHPDMGQYWIVADTKDQPLGMCLTLFEWSDWRCRQVMWIHSVYVLPEARGQGVYTTLYSFLKKKVERSQRYSGLRLYVDKKNLNAQKVYQKLGMNNQHYDLYEWMKTT